ncbi:hypothetical protein PFISCL1PPCAC_2521 [Pristionchus fissidentatus]|uniref:Potassium channel domain-containing protein n=1 Tax=Pristionchus fissidentatus TaxID=1538716 RepID=A0AAV5UVR9_9BILA|nr:hypothetical protein PFISCL1PPCAC_2521 [Pristionchus fissidentatus]
MPPKEAKEEKSKSPKKRVGTIKKKFETRSKSADASRRNIVSRGFNVVSKSLPSLNRVKVKGEVVSEGEKAPKEEKKKKKRRRRRRRSKDGSTAPSEPASDTIIVVKKEENHKKTIWKHVALLFLLFAYSLLGGLVFSAIEGGHDQQQLTARYERSVDLFRRRKNYQHMIYRRFKDIDEVLFKTRPGQTMEDLRLEMVREALAWYEKKLGITINTPSLESTRWNLWGGVYYAASLYTTIGYGNFAARTVAGRIISMMYAFVGIPLVFWILLEWGFLYFTFIEYGWKRFIEMFCQSQMKAEIERKKKRERFRRVGSELSLGSMSTMPLISVHGMSNGHQTDHQIESNRPLRPKDVELSNEEQVKTVPMKAALVFFFLWLCISAFVVRLWETDWSYFTAFYFFFNSLTTVGLGDVVTKTPNFIIFNLALTMVGLSVVGLCLAIVQAKVRLIFDRMVRSIDSQYRIRQIDPDVAVMTLVKDENEGIKRLAQSQRIEERLIFAVMDEHRKSLLRDRWKRSATMVNRATQTYPSKADKMIQTGNRVYDQPKDGEGDGGSIWGDSDEFTSESETESSEDEDLLNPRRYIYTVYD